MPSGIPDDRRFSPEEAFRFQSALCLGTGGPFTAELLSRCADDARAPGAVSRLIADWPGDPMREFLPLRVAAALHHRALRGLNPELGAHYPSTGGTPSWPELWPLVEREIDTARDALRPWLDRFPQTNEIGRCGALAAGFHRVARRTGLPLRLLEMGASAGLNLFWDRHRYRLGGATWGDPAASITLRPEWEGDDPQFAPDLRVESRRACDMNPIRIEDPREAERLEAYVWADHVERVKRLRRAVALARSDPPELVRARAGDWLPEQLALPRSDVATVIYHSSFWAYVPEEEQRRVEAAIAEAGAQADDRTPLAWLRLEHFGPSYELRLRQWPGGGEERLATANSHGRSVHWLNSADSPSAPL